MAVTIAHNLVPLFAVEIRVTYISAHHHFVLFGHEDESYESAAVLCMSVCTQCNVLVHHY
jgi:hypothetical protein